MSSKVKETWSTEPAESTIRNDNDDPSSKLGTTGSIIIDPSNGLSKISTNLTTIHRTENPKEMKPSIDSYLGGLSETKEKAERHWKSHAETDKHKNAHGKDTTSTCEGDHEPTFKGDWHWEA